MTISMFMRKDSHTIGAGGLQGGDARPSGRTTGCDRVDSNRMAGLPIFNGSSSNDPTNQRGAAVAAP